MMGLSLRVMTGIRCSVCDRLMDTESRESNLGDALFCGLAHPYAVCPNCFAQTSESEQEDPEFRRRARVLYFTRWQRVLREPPGIASGAVEWPQIAYTREPLERPLVWRSAASYGIYKGYPYGEYAKSKCPRT